MFCSRCGKTIAQDAERCPSCDAPIGESRFAGVPYTSAQAKLVPGGSAYVVTSDHTYTRTTYTGMDESAQAGVDVDSRTTYRPVYEGASAPEDIRRDMRAAVDADNLEPPVLGDDERVSQLFEDDTGELSGFDMSQIRSRPIKSTGRAGISQDVHEYVQRLETDKGGRRIRRTRVYDDTAQYAQGEGEAYDDDVVAEPQSVNAVSGFGLGRVLKILAGVLILAGLVFGGVKWYQYVNENKQAAPIEGITLSLYEQGIALVEQNSTNEKIDTLLSSYESDGILTLATQLENEAAAYKTLMPAEPSVNDPLFVNVLETIQENISNCVTMDALALSQADANALTDSAARWQVVQNSIERLKSATTAAELTAILDGEKVAVSTPTPVPTPTIGVYNTLSKGDKSQEVLDMQNRLWVLGFLLDDRDGAFGTNTQTAVKLFQSAAGLEVNGRADAATLTVLYSDDAPQTQYSQITPTPAPTPTPTPTPTLTSEELLQ